MRIAWVTPFERKSSIGRCSSLVVPILAERDEVHLWRPPADDPWPSPVSTETLNPDASRIKDTLTGYDIVVYQMGNYLPYHRLIFEASRRVPGICVLHDFVMQNFFAALYLEVLRSPDSYMAVMERHYGAEGRRRAAVSLAGSGPKPWEGEAVLEYPLFEEAIRGAYGVVVHSEFLCERVRRIYSGPLLRLGLPHDVTEYRTGPNRQDLGIPENAHLFVIIGHVNPNKRVELVIDALAQVHELKDRAILALVGPCERGYEESIRRLAHQRGIGSALKFTGYVSQETLHAFIRLSDVCINLRYPACEGASGSAVEQMLHGKPIVVNDTGFFQELPLDTVVKLPVRADASALAAALSKLVSDPELRSTLGFNARRYADGHFSPVSYARQILRFFREVRYCEPVLRLADQIGAELGQFGVTPDMEIVGHTSSVVGNLFHRPGADAEGGGYGASKL